MANHDNAHIYRGIFQIINILGVEYEIDDCYTETYPYKASFTYDGIEYFQISETEVFR